MLCCAVPVYDQISGHNNKLKAIMSEVTERSWDLSPYEVNREAQNVIKTSTNIAVSSKVSIVMRGGEDEVRAWV